MAKVVTSIFSSTPTIHVAKTQLSYPLYAADFDPLNHHFLLVGGGGGSSSTGVPNRISLLDTSNRSELKEISDIELAPDEDSVTSLAIADSDDQSLLVYAGINSSEKDLKTGKNEHFRSFRVPLPARRKRDVDPEKENLHTANVARSQALTRTAIFKSTDPGQRNECYQRVLRVSAPVVVEAGEKNRLKERIATIASGLAASNELISFAVEERPSSKSTLSRLNLEKIEAGDVDMIDVGGADRKFALAYCTDNLLYLQTLTNTKGTTNSEPVKVYETQPGPVGRSKIRALRFLNSRYLLLVQNRVNRSGVELAVFKTSKDYAQVNLVLIKYLGHMKQAVGLDTCTLSEGSDGAVQFVVAIAGQDSSVQVQVLSFVPGVGVTSFKQYADVVDVHNGPITRIVFSKFIAPTSPAGKQSPPQYIRLATVGVDKSVVVQTLPLQPTPAGGKQNSRYVLIAPSGFGSIFSGILGAILVLILGLTILLTFLELKGAVPPIVGTARYLPQRWQEAYKYSHDNPGPVIPDSIPQVQSVIDQIKLSEATPLIEKLEELEDRIKLAAATPVIEKLQEMQSSIPSIEEVKENLVDLVSQKGEDEHKDKAVIIRDLEHLGGEITAELKHEAEIVKEGTLKKWEQLTGQEKKSWKAKMKAAGQWTEKQGETVLKGVFFGQLGALVGEFARGA